MDKSLTTKIVTAVLVVFFLIMLISQFVIKSENTVKTEVAMRYDSQETVEFDGVFVRDEHTISRDYNGVLRYEHENGSKLGINSVIASVYSSARDVEICRELDSLEQRINTLKDAQSLSGTDNSQIEAFNKLITEKHSEIVKAIDNGDFSAAAGLKYELLNLQCKRDMAKGRTVDYEQIISSLETKKQTLESSISSQPTSIISGETGYFVNSIDGYESTLSFDNAEKLTPEEIESIVKNPSVAANTGAEIGKMIESYKWRIAAVLNETEAAAVSENTRVELVAGSGPATVRAYVESKNKCSDGKYVVIFSSDELAGELSAQRTEHFKLLIDSFNGIRISASAIHFDKDNNIGVFVKRGVKCVFKKIKTIYSGDGYVIAEDTTGNTDYLSLYDSIITEGKDLYDNKIL